LRYPTARLCACVHKIDPCGVIGYTRRPLQLCAIWRGISAVIRHQFRRYPLDRILRAVPIFTPRECPQTIRFADISLSLSLSLSPLFHVVSREAALAERSDGNPPLIPLVIAPELILDPFLVDYRGNPRTTVLASRNGGSQLPGYRLGNITRGCPPQLSSRHRKAAVPRPAGAANPELRRADSSPDRRTSSTRGR